MKNMTDISTAIKQGQQQRKRLEYVVKKAVNINPDAQYPHTYIYSPPGLGKTYTVTQQLKQSDRVFFELSGAVSMFAFGVSLATINFLVPKDKTVIISVDDCDGIFKNEENINIMKNVLSGRKIFAYEKSLQSQIANMTEVQQQAIEHHQVDDRMGFTVPTDRMIFIFTSNFRLPDDDEVSQARQKGGAKNVLKVHRNAIRSRCKTMDFDLDKEQHFGWMMDVLENTSLSTRVSQEQSQTIKTWVWDNWSNMTERSIRTLEKMIETMIEEPDDYIMAWEIDYLK
jgi:hypothetical protein